MLRVVSAYIDSNSTLLMKDLTWIALRPFMELALLKRTYALKITLNIM